MTNEERIHNVTQLGYSNSEAHFLCLAALHAGFFVPRQFNMFLGKAPGWRDLALGEKLIANRHGKLTAFRHNRKLYHICSKPFYDRLGEQDNRNRREREVYGIKQRLMALDFVLSMTEQRFLPTESEKLAFFCDELKIGSEPLPAKLYRSQNGKETTIRYFVDKYPIFVSQPQGGAPSVVHFCFVDEGVHSTSGFERYLTQYQPLFARLRQFQVWYLASFDDHFNASRILFDRMVGAGCARPVDPLVLRLLEYFRTRQAYEKRELKEFSQPRITQFREDRQVFAGIQYEALFAKWTAGGDDAVLTDLAPESVQKRTANASFRTHRLPFRYELFGTLANGKWKGEIPKADRK